MVARPSSSASLGGHIGRRQQEKNESGRPCAYLLLRFPLRRAFSPMVFVARGAPSRILRLL